MKPLLRLSKVQTGGSEGVREGFVAMEYRVSWMEVLKSLKKQSCFAWDINSESHCTP